MRETNVAEDWKRERVYECIPKNKYMTSMEPTQLLDVINLWWSGQVCVTHRVLKEQRRGERK